jgi:hypothetical protein
LFHERVRDVRRPLSNAMSDEQAPIRERFQLGVDILAPNDLGNERRIERGQPAASQQQLALGLREHVEL